MAERRMFAKKITESDAFLDMPSSSQALYFHLNMSADDDGFVNNPKKIKRDVGASDDDLKLLLAKQFIVAFESGIIVITHWKMHNYIQKDRYRPTDYIEEKSMLELRDNKSYSLKSSLYTNRIQNGYVGKVSIGKDSIGKVNKNINDDSSESSSELLREKNAKAEELEREKHNFEEIYKRYPKKKGKAKAFDYYRQYLKGRKMSTGTVKLTNEQMWTAVKKYKEEKESKDTELEFYQDFSTFMNKTILDYLEE